MNDEHQTILIELIKYGLGLSDKPLLSYNVNWEDVFQLAFEHRVCAIALDGIQRCYDNGYSIDIDEDTKLDWISELKFQEADYKQQKKVIVSLAHFYQQHEIKMMVLKGYALSLNYPKPILRNCCDLDIYLFGNQKKADELLEKELGIKVVNDHHCHTVFEYNGVSVENHYDFLNVYSHRSTKKYDEHLKKLADTESVVHKINNETIYLPTADFDALFVLRHMAVEFAATGMILRQLLDWGLLMKKYHTAINWNMVLPMVKEMNMHQFLDAINYICYTYLRFEKNTFHGFGNEAYGEKVWADLFNPNNMQPKEQGCVKYIFSRCKNWWRNRWRHEIVYSDSLFSTFFYQTIAHLMKPATLHH